MKAIPFNKNVHYEQMLEWLKDRKMPPIPLDYLPSIGRIVPDKCMGFIYQTDSKIALLETIISAVVLDRTDMSEAIDVCITALENDAKKLGFKLLWCSTFLPGMVDRGKNHGCIVSPEKYYLLTKEIA